MLGVGAGAPRKAYLAFESRDVELAPQSAATRQVKSDGAIVALPPGKWVCGRKAPADIRVSDPESKISSRHCRICMYAVRWSRILRDVVSRCGEIGRISRGP